ncbi:MFS transporter [Burkholderia mayonis]|uniref:MFS transporter n=1 Tax=Burkholderia mayonis TaxID=1385591 RepID=A0A1B4FAF6_9BURK|nr:MFS transporter [Burkholderia mayonis]AOJ00628.1 MFS transporter [Burkholderia mayonis]KVE45224.1 MFS transporter [Burkholderia mayonis]
MNRSADLRADSLANRPCASPALTLTPALTVFFSVTVGMIVLNLFAAQPLTGPIAADLRLPSSLTGLVAMLPQLGYAAGLALLVPLIDLIENRRLIVTTLAVCAATLALPAVTRSGTVYLAAVFIAGAASSVIQMLVPMAASMAPEKKRGRAVGNVMSGLMLGILLSRPLASLIAGTAGWRAFYGTAAAADIAIAAVLAAKLPPRAPSLSTRYAALLGSLWTLVSTERVLQRRALSAGLSMGAFSAFWTAIGLRLAAAPFGLGLHGIAMFAFAGATGAIVTPFAGLAGDRGWERGALRGAHVAMLVALAALGVAGADWGGFDATAHPMLALALLVAGAAALDAGVVADQTLGRRAINLLNPAARGRLNGLFVGLFFVGGSLGAMLAGAAWAWAGWGAVCAVGFAFAGAAFALDWVAVRRRTEC